jgi:3-phenylpropionate/trans-cinnamate dioxygenase ferredoxin reductase component
MESGRPLVIIGASYAGVQLAASARELGFEERIVIAGDERHMPYQRPPLSKGLLTGKTQPDQLLLRSPDFYTHNRIELLLGHRAESFDPVQRVVRLDDGSALEYGWLALATGARCRPLPIPGAHLEGVLQLRTLDEALSIASAARTAQRACIVGGGFIGLEVAAALRSGGMDVTVVESQPRLLMRSFPPLMSSYIERAHASRATAILTGRGVRELMGTQRIEAIELDGGERLACDLLILGIGVLPNMEIAQAAGVETHNGILVDSLGRTGMPQVLAIGDVANMMMHPSLAMPGRMRLESIQAANAGARAAASVLVGRQAPCASVPWFWSDQYQLKLQMAGVPALDDEVVVRGDMAADRFSLFYLRDGAVAGAHSVNRPAEHMLSRKLIAARARPSRSQLADESFDLKAALA